MSVDSNGIEGNAESGATASISSDGRYVAFSSWADNLVANDTNGQPDVFVHDRATGATVRVSVDSSGAEGNGDSNTPSLSQDGRFVAFQSSATNLVANDTNGTQDIFVHDRDPDGNGRVDEGNGVTTRVSLDSSGIEANGPSYAPSIPGDGRLVAFESTASNLVTGDSISAQDIFIHDRASGSTTRVSVDSAGGEANSYSYGATLSADGKVVAFTSYASNLVAGDTNRASDVFVRDIGSGTTTRVSVSTSGTEGDSESGASFFALSADGQIVAFWSNASNLVANDTNSTRDVFVHDRATSTTTRVSVDAAGREGDDFSAWGALSADGQIVAFHSWAGNLVANDTNGTGDVFVHDRTTGATTVSSTGCGVLGNADSWFPSLSGDGNLVSFSSYADNLAPHDTNLVSDVLVHDLTIDDDGEDASWSSYGAGFPGTLGEPGFTARNDPVLGTTLTLDVGNSYGQWTVGFLLAGWSRDSVDTNLGGTLLVGDVFLFLPFPIEPGGTPLDADLPSDPGLCGLVVDSQVLELDPGAQRGVSFTAGLELVFGH